MQDIAMTTTLRSSTDDARAALWTGILGAAKHLGKREPLSAARRPAVVRLREGNAETPVYFIDYRLSQFNLAQSMATDRSIFAVEIPWPAAWHDLTAENETEGMPTVEQMVVPYVEAIAAHARSKRCVLVGYSFGGIMAFEAAHQLAERGIDVETVMLLDAPAVYPTSHQVTWEKLQEIWLRPSDADRTHRPAITQRLASSWSIIQWMLTDKMTGWGQRFVNAVNRTPAKLTTKLDDIGRPLPWPLIQFLYDNAFESYRPRRFDGRAILFRAALRDQCPSRSLENGLGWDGLFGKGVQVVEVTGDHLTMMREQGHVLKLAQEMTDALNRSSPNRTPDGKRDVLRDVLYVASAAR
jgi:thioesterase domain-containing protein